MGLVAIGGAVAALGIAVWFSLMTDVRLADNHIDEVVHLEAELHREIGYGGLIHNFKNYVLRGAENYRTAAMRDHERVSGLLDQLDTLIDGDARAYLATVRATLDAYRNNLDVAAAARARGLDAEGVDALVHIDDSMAIHALGVRMRESHLALIDQRDTLYDAQLQVFVALCIFLGAILAIIVLVTLGIARRIRDLEARVGGGRATAVQPTNARSIT